VDINVEPINARSMIDAAATAGGAPRVERRRRLSAAALAVTNQKVRKAYSPIVIAGLVRLADFVLIAAIGLAVYLCYVARLDGFSWFYPISILCVTLASVTAFQAADLYEVQMFRGKLRQMTRLISAWTLVFLLFIGVSFFLKIGTSFSRLWLSAYFVCGLTGLIAGRL
jgi:hypothetical protein